MSSRSEVYWRRIASKSNSNKIECNLLTKSMQWLLWQKNQTWSLAGGGAEHRSNCVQITPDSTSLSNMSTISGPYLSTNWLQSFPNSPGITEQTSSSACTIAAFNLKSRLSTELRRNQQQLSNLCAVAFDHLIQLMNHQATDNTGYRVRNALKTDYCGKIWNSKPMKLILQHHNFA